MKPWSSTELRLHNSESALTRTLLLLPTSPSYRDTPVLIFGALLVARISIEVASKVLSITSYFYYRSTFVVDGNKAQKYTPTSKTCYALAFWLVFETEM